MRSTPERRIRHPRRVPVVPQLAAALPAPPRRPWVGHWGPVRAPVFGAGARRVGGGARGGLAGSLRARLLAPPPLGGASGTPTGGPGWAAAGCCGRRFSALARAAWGGALGGGLGGGLRARVLAPPPLGGVTCAPTGGPGWAAAGCCGRRFLALARAAWGGELGGGQGGGVAGSILGAPFGAAPAVVRLGYHARPLDVSCRTGCYCAPVVVLFVDGWNLMLAVDAASALHASLRAPASMVAGVRRWGGPYFGPLEPAYRSHRFGHQHMTHCPEPFPFSAPPPLPLRRCLRFLSPL